MRQLERTRDHKRFSVDIEPEFPLTIVEVLTKENTTSPDNLLRHLRQEMNEKRTFLSTVIGQIKVVHRKYVYKCNCDNIAKVYYGDAK